MTTPPLYDLFAGSIHKGKMLCEMGHEKVVMHNVYIATFKIKISVCTACIKYIAIMKCTVVAISIVKQQNSA